MSLRTIIVTMIAIWLWILEGAKQGLVSNFRQALAVWLVFILLAAVMAGDIAITAGASGSIRILRYVFYCMGGAGLVLISFIYPVMAAFEDTLPHLLRNALFFASRNPFRALGVAALTVGPLIFTYMDLARLPLYAFLWAFFGFAGIAMLVSRLLIRDFNRFLPEAEGQGEEPV